MKDGYYVIFNRKGIDRFCKSETFQLKPGEHAVKIMLEVADEVFVKPPIPVTRVIVDPSQVVRNIGVEGAEEQPPSGGGA